jgi:hypothetical protein
MARRISEQERVELFFIGASFEVARLTKTTGEKTNG